MPRVCDNLSCHRHHTSELRNHHRFSPPPPLIARHASLFKCGNDFVGRQACMTQSEAIRSLLGRQNTRRDTQCLSLTKLCWHLSTSLVTVRLTVADNPEFARSLKKHMLVASQDAARLYDEGRSLKKSCSAFYSIRQEGISERDPRAVLLTRRQRECSSFYAHLC